MKERTIDCYTCIIWKEKRGILEEEMKTTTTHLGQLGMSSSKLLITNTNYKESEIFSWKNLWSQYQWRQIPMNQFHASSHSQSKVQSIHSIWPLNNVSQWFSSRFISPSLVVFSERCTPILSSDMKYKEIWRQKPHDAPSLQYHFSHKGEYIWPVLILGTASRQYTVLSPETCENLESHRQKDFWDHKFSRPFSGIPSSWNPSSSTYLGSRQVDNGEPVRRMSK